MLSQSRCFWSLSKESNPVLYRTKGGIIQINVSKAINLVRHPRLELGLVRWQRAVLPLTLITQNWLSALVSNQPEPTTLSTPYQDEEIPDIKLEHLRGIDPPFVA